VVSSFVTESYGPEHVANPEYRPWKVRAAHLVDALTARFVARFHAVSASSADVMIRRLRIKAANVEVIPRGRDPERLGRRAQQRRLRTREVLGVAADVPIVLAAGRHYHMKGLDVAASAWPEVAAAFPEAQLLIAGREGPATVEILRLVEQGGVTDSVTLLGYRSDVPDLMAAADVFVLPSRAEGSPGVLIEAMALELPTVASEIPSVLELADVANPVVELVPVDSPSDLAKGIMRLLGDRELASRLAAAARQRYSRHYTLDAVADATVRLYERCARSVPPVDGTHSGGAGEPEGPV
jgi:glycosyltransferase involved in cell wall biosynthesis